MTINSFKSRLAWLGRMPTKYKALFTSQILIMFFAAKIRARDIKRSNALLEQKEQQVKETKTQSKQEQTQYLPSSS